MSHLLSVLYQVKEREFKAFRQYWCGPETYNHFEETLIARYEKEENDDGQNVEVYCNALPSRFYQIKALKSRNSIDEEVESFTLSFSGQENLVHEMALSISKGLVNLKR